jgi:hypothetical protein
LVARCLSLRAQVRFWWSFTWQVAAGSILRWQLTVSARRASATLIVDSFAPRNEPKGVCANLGNLDGEKAMQYATRGSNDALAAVSCSHDPIGL